MWRGMISAEQSPGAVVSEELRQAVRLSTVSWKLVFSLSVLVICAAGSAVGDETPVHQYVGVKKCAVCHKAKARGNQYGHWLETKHAHAYETLKSDKAAEVSKKRGLETPAHEAEACLKCHITGYGKPPESFAKSFNKEDGVQCESCHGAGGDYRKIKIMKDVDLAKANGLIIPSEEVCLTCHNKESPFYDGFDFKKSFARIAHPDPKVKNLH